MRQCLGIGREETVLVVCDKKTKPVAEVFFHEAALLAKKVILVTIPVGKVHGEEPPELTARIMRECDAALLITTKSLTHTNARKKATERGVRIASMPCITFETACRAIPVDYKKVARLNKKLLQAFSGARTIIVRTAKGTHFAFGLSRPFLVDSGIYTKKGAFGNLPAGEVFVAPKEGSANGVVVIDASIADKKLERPVKLFVRNGFVESISEKWLDKLLRRFGKNAFNIAEFGVGTNPKAMITGSVLEDEKVLGTCHIALGNNTGLGGKIYAKCHIDGVLKKPTIYADKKIVVKNGRIVV